MKKILYILLLLPLMVIGQSTDQNYVRTYTYKDATTSTDASKAHATVIYYDGLGRPVQQVAGKMSGGGKDMITHIEYDVYGRQPREYLPYEASAANLAFDAAAYNNVHSFYDTPYFDETKNPYTEKIFEASPLNRVLKQAAPGNSWKAHYQDDNDHTVKYAYTVNSESTNVKKYSAVSQLDPVTGIYSSVQLTDEGYYDEGELYRTITQDENNAYAIATESFMNSRYTEEFKDKEGRLIAKKIAYGSEDEYGMPVMSVIFTHYIYDQF